MIESEVFVFASYNKERLAQALIERYRKLKEANPESPVKAWALWSGVDMYCDSGALSAEDIVNRYEADYQAYLNKNAEYYVRKEVEAQQELVRRQNAVNQLMLELPDAVKDPKVLLNWFFRLHELSGFTGLSIPAEEILTQCLSSGYSISIETALLQYTKTPEMSDYPQRLIGLYLSDCHKSIENQESVLFNPALLRVIREWNRLQKPKGIFRFFKK